MVISGVLKSGTIKKGDVLYLGPNGNGFLRDENNVILDKTTLSKKMITKITTKIAYKQNETKQNETKQNESDLHNYYKVVVKNIHNNFKENVDVLYAGQSGCFNIKPHSNKTVLKRKMVKKGMRLVSVINSVS